MTMCHTLVRLCPLAISFVFAMPPASAHAETSEMIRYPGFCEASAATLLSGGQLVVASDDRIELAVFQDAGAGSLSGISLGDITDLEAVAQFGDLTIWLTSHSTNKDGEDKTKRKLMIATTMDSDGSLIISGAPYRELRSIITKPLQQVGYQFDINSAPGWNNLNIEGLARASDGNALIGLRSPQIGGKAVILRVSGLVEAVLYGRDPTVERVQLIDLDGLTVRGMDTLPDGRVLILAGLPGDIPLGQEGILPLPQVFLWDGNAPTAEKIADLPTAMIGEAIIAKGDNKFIVLGDNGDILLENGEACSDKNFPQVGAWFPVIEISLPVDK